MSQTELARKAGCERSHISEMLSGRLERFSLDRINRVLAVFEASIQVNYQLIFASQGAVPPSVRGVG